MQAEVSYRNGHREHEQLYDHYREIYQVGMVFELNLHPITLDEI